MGDGNRLAKRQAKQVARLLRKSQARQRMRAVDHSKVTGQPLLQFDLAPLTEFNAGHFTGRQGRDGLAQVVLSLALAFNDLKDLEMFRWALYEKPPAVEGEVTTYAGQWSGVLVHLHRWVAATLHEVLRLIDENRRVIESKPFQDLVARLSPEALVSWLQLCDAANGKEATSKVLVRIRNGNAFHYYDGAALLGGFREAFFSASTDARHRAPMLSRGKNMEQTRFYFADAAACAELQVACEKSNAPELNEIMSTLGRSANVALFELVTAYINRPEASIAKEET